MQKHIRPFNIRNAAPLDTAVLRDVLGTGRHGTVFRGHLGDLKPVAIKIASDGHSLRNEVLALRALTHPNIVALHAHHVPTSMAVELCAAGTLTDRIARGDLDLDEVRDIFLGVASALDYIHNAGWIHGDISPSNIGLRPGNGPALFDFSTARKADGGEIQQGTEDYAGDLREAVPSFDIRCTAAVAQKALDQLTTSPEVGQVLDHLNELIEKADAGAAVAVSDLRRALISDENPRITEIPPIASALPRITRPPQPPAGATRDFGPRPGGQGPGNELDTDSRTPLAAALIAFGVFVALSALAFELFIGGPTEISEQATEAEASLRVERVMTARRTLEISSASWDSESGTLTRQIDDDTEVWKVGEPGDLAAIADWNCDGTETLGVLRPTTSVWFTFADWQVDSTSTVEYLDANVVISELDIATDATGCAHPLTAS